MVAGMYGSVHFLVVYNDT